jgi:hypothetical protein
MNDVYIKPTPGSMLQKILRSVVTNVHNKLDNLSLAGLFTLALRLWVRPGAFPKAEHLKDASPGFSQRLY